MATSYLSISALRTRVEDDVTLHAGEFSVGAAGSDDMTQDQLDQRIKDALRLVADHLGLYTDDGGEALLDGALVPVRWTHVVAYLAADEILLQTAGDYMADADERGFGVLGRRAMENLLRERPTPAVDEGDAPESAPTSGDGSQVFTRDDVDDFRDAYE